MLAWWHVRCGRSASSVTVHLEWRALTDTARFIARRCTGEVVVEIAGPYRTEHAGLCDWGVTSVAEVQL